MALEKRLRLPESIVTKLPVKFRKLLSFLLSVSDAASPFYLFVFKPQSDTLVLIKT